MSKQSKRILIIDDDITMHAKNMDYMFHDCGVEVEVQHVRFSDEAIGVLERWFKNGYKPDSTTFTVINTLLCFGGHLLPL